MTELTQAICAIAPTKRRRYLWCAWWTGVPTPDEFRPPDAWGGGATSPEEAHRMAERAAGRPLELVDGPWAGAWRRVLAGSAPYPDRSRRPTTGTIAPVDPHAVLGVRTTDPHAIVKAAYWEKARAHHPDRGGSPEAFIAIKRAYDAIVRRRSRRVDR